MLAFPRTRLKWLHFHRIKVIYRSIAAYIMYKFAWPSDHVSSLMCLQMKMLIKFGRPRTYTFHIPRKLLTDLIMDSMEALYHIAMSS